MRFRQTGLAQGLRIQGKGGHVIVVLQESGQRDDSLDIRCVRNDFRHLQNSRDPGLIQSSLDSNEFFPGPAKHSDGARLNVVLRNEFNDLPAVQVYLFIRLLDVKDFGFNVGCGPVCLNDLASRAIF